MPKISVAIATHNEEANIAPCLGSVKEWVEEIILVDGSSTDKTAEIARSLGAKVFTAPNEAMFHINKQKAIDICKGDWILQLDADEVITPELKKEILDLLNLPASPAGRQPTTYNSRPNGYWIPRKNYFLGKYLMKGGQYPDYMLRLYRRGKGRLPCKSVHEQADVEGKVEYLNNPLLHNSYPNFSHYLEHFNLYTTILSHELKDKSIHINWSSTIKYCIVYPKWWFFKTYIRHKGFQDGFPGFVFSLFSSLRFPVAYIKYWESKHPPPKK